MWAHAVNATDRHCCCTVERGEKRDGEYSEIRGLYSVHNKYGYGILQMHIFCASLPLIFFFVKRVSTEYLQRKGAWDKGKFTRYRSMGLIIGWSHQAMHHQLYDCLEATSVVLGDRNDLRAREWKRGTWAVRVSSSTYTYYCTEYSSYIIVIHKA